MANVDQFQDDFSDIFGEQAGNQDPVQQNSGSTDITPETQNFDDIFNNPSNDNPNPQQGVLDSLRNVQNPTNVIEMALLKNGFNPKAIRINDEAGNVTTTDFESLPIEDQYSLLFSQDKNPSDDLDEEEIHLLNSIRSSGMSPKDYIKSVIESAASKQPANPNPQQSVNTLDDDTLFLADLKLRYGDTLTKEEMFEHLDQAKSNPQLYEKTIGILRKNYEDQEKQSEEEYNKYQEENAKQQMAQLNYNMDMSMNNPKFIDLGNGAIQLSQEDKNDIKSFVFGKAADGNTYLYNALRNPDVLTKVAWFILKGNDFMSEMIRDYESQIENASKSSYQKGFAMAGGKNTIRKTGGSTSNFKPTAEKKYRSVDDLY